MTVLWVLLVFAGVLAGYYAGVKDTAAGVTRFRGRPAEEDTLLTETYADAVNDMIISLDDRLNNIERRMG